MVLFISFLHFTFCTVFLSVVSGRRRFSPILRERLETQVLSDRGVRPRQTPALPPAFFVCPGLGDCVSQLPDTPWKLKVSHGNRGLGTGGVWQWHVSDDLAPRHQTLRVLRASRCTSPPWKQDNCPSLSSTFRGEAQLSRSDSSIRGLETDVICFPILMSLKACDKPCCRLFISGTSTCRSHSQLFAPLGDDW